MKNYALLFFVALLSFSCSKTITTETILSGNIENSPNGLISIVGTEFEKDIVLEEDGSFQAELELPYNGYYNVILGRIPLQVYLEKGKDLDITMDISKLKETLKFSGDLGAENSFLISKKDVVSVDMRELFSEETASFLTSVEGIETDLNAALKETGITNENFLKSQEKENLYQKASYINSYKEYHQYLTETEEIQLPNDFYNAIETINFADESEFKKSNSYQQLVEGYLGRKAIESPSDDSKNVVILYMEVLDKTYPTGYAKNQLLKSVMGYSLKADKYLDKVYEMFMGLQTDEELKKEMTESYTALSKITPGNASPTFTYENYEGGETSLEDLKGKYVYIDVWATWCAPCIREIPYLKEVAEDYKDKDVVFVGISIDDAKDYEKWQNMVDEKELVGVQLYSGGEAWQVDFVQEYRIQGIPRFILVDPEGNIFDSDTYRPSDKKLRDLFDEIL